MDSASLARLRARLIRTCEQRRRVRESVAGSLQSETMTEAVGELSSYDNHTGDLATEMVERGKDLGLLRRTDAVIADCEGALKRMTNGTYGWCAQCGKPIEEARLEAVPWADRCTQCAEGDAPPDRPPEEDPLSPPFGRTFLDGEDSVVYDGEDAWQDVARHGTSNAPVDVGGRADPTEAYVDSDERVGTVEDVESITDGKARSEKRTGFRPRR